HRSAHVPRRLSLKAVHAGHARAARRLAAIKRACALGGVSLALLAGGAAHAQDATHRGSANPNASSAGTPWTPGTESFAPAFGAPVTNPFGYAMVAGANIPTTYIVTTFGDLDADGDLDMMTGGNTGIFIYYPNTAGAGNTPAFGPQQNQPFGLTTDLGGFTSPSFADLDGDGDLDLAVGLQSGGTSIIINTGTPAAPAFGAAVSVGISGTFNGVTAADFDGDGDVDLLSGNNAGAFIYRQNTAGRGNAPVFAAPVTNPFGLTGTGAASYNQPSAADFDRDGDIDVLSQTASGTYTYFQNTAGPAAAPTFIAPVTNPFGLVDPGASGVQPGIGDLDGDGDLDVMSSIGSATTSIVYQENTEAGADLSATLTGTDGWRLLTAPSATNTLNDLLGEIWTQGFPGADNAGGTTNVVRYNEPTAGGLTAGYVAPTNITDLAGGGRGFFVYVYADDDPFTAGTQGGFPKTLTVPGAEPASPFTISNLTYTDTGDTDAQDGWNLIGNPFARWVDWDATARTLLTNTVQVWNPATSSYLTWNGTAGSLPGGIIAPFQGFWVKVSSPAGPPPPPPPPSPPPFGGPSVIGSMRLRAETYASGGPFYGRGVNEVVSILGLRLQRADGDPMRADAFVTLGEPDVTTGIDNSDGYFLTPPASDFLTLGAEVQSPEGTTLALAIDARPAPTDHLEIPLRVRATEAGVPGGGAMVLTWPQFQDVPAQWSVTLRDSETGASVDLRTQTQYAFTLTPSLTGGTPVAPGTMPALTSPVVLDEAANSAVPPRFSIVIEPSGVTANEPGTAGAFALAPAYPNPSNGADLAVPFTAGAAADVTIEVFDALGRRVAVVAEGRYAPGPHTVSLATSTLPAGVYVVRALMTPDAGAVQTFAQRVTIVH
ncbi:MAG TPA: FG-GAP-like repeat-containing protein, partial [Rhodothermales bacterium]|nr:FG-GAP-like repeat-containing protein [Rhodothermales bacterium]